MSALQEMEQEIRGVAERAGKNVVGVGQRWGVGSGVAIGGGTILTNAHNVRSGEVAITLPDGSSTTGTVAGADLDGDIAVITVDEDLGEGIEWGDDPGSLGIGSLVFALSNPGGRGLRVTFGFVSGTERSFRGPRGRRIAGSIEHTAPLLPGSSGGPIVDSSGRFLGLNTNRLGEGFYLAIPSDSSLKERAAALGKGKVPRRPRLGVGLAPARVAKNLRRAVGLAPEDGLLVRAVEDGSPAADAGIKEGDLLVEAGGRKLADFDVLYETLETSGSELEVKLLRGAEEQTIRVSLS
jgi:serine protease Do